MVAADEVHVVWVLQLQRQQQAHRLQTVAASAGTGTGTDANNTQRHTACLTYVAVAKISYQA